MRDLTRSGVKLVEEHNRVHKRIHKVLEDANLKLDSVASDILGVTGRGLLRSILAGHEDPGWLADNEPANALRRPGSHAKALEEGEPVILQSDKSDHRVLTEEINSV